MAWVKAHSTAKETAQMTQQNERIALASDKADELAKGGASHDKTNLQRKWRRERLRSARTQMVW